MKRIIIAAAFLGCFIASAFAGSMILLGAGSPPQSGGGGYTGPGDVVAGAKAYWGLRCYDNAYSGNLADITDSATGNTTGTRLVCSAGNVITAVSSSSACATTSGGGTFVTGGACSPLATTCATACNVLTLYDQSGALACAGGTACDATMSANTSRFPLTQVGGAGCTTTSFMCLQSTGIGKCLQSVNNLTLAQPISIVATAKHPTGGGGAVSAILGATTTTTVALFSGTAGTILESFGTTQNFAGVTDNTFHAMQFIGSGASSSVNADGTSTGAVNAGTNGFSAEKIQLGEWASSANTCNSDSDIFSGEEWIIYGVALNATQISNLNSNQHTYWGF